MDKTIINELTRDNGNRISATWDIRLGNKKQTIQRQVYTIMTMIGDIGGF